MLYKTVKPKDEEMHAKLCAELIRQYWARQGKDIVVRLEKTNSRHLSTSDFVWTIRSDMKLGVPRGKSL